jgi:hypothetical protein
MGPPHCVPPSLSILPPCLSKALHLRPYILFNVPTPKILAPWLPPCNSMWRNNIRHDCVLPSAPLWSTVASGSARKVRETPGAMKVMCRGPRPGTVSHLLYRWGKIFNLPRSGQIHRGCSNTLGEACFLPVFAPLTIKLHQPPTYFFIFIVLLPPSCKKGIKQKVDLLVQGYCKSTNLSKLPLRSQAENAASGGKRAHKLSHNDYAHVEKYYTGTG